MAAITDVWGDTVSSIIEEPFGSIKLYFNKRGTSKQSYLGTINPKKEALYVPEKVILKKIKNVKYYAFRYPVINKATKFNKVIVKKKGGVDNHIVVKNEWILDNGELFTKQLGNFSTFIFVKVSKIKKLTNGKT